MVDIVSFAHAVLPQGTTTIACDNHEITNVFGVRAVELFHKAALGLPLKVMVAMPVCVPSIPASKTRLCDYLEGSCKAYEEDWAHCKASR